MVFDSISISQLLTCKQPGNALSAAREFQIACTNFSRAISSGSPMEDLEWDYRLFDVQWNQVHEMLYIEKGGEAQIADELAAYNPLIPKGAELVATIMFEIDDPLRRKNFLQRLGGVEETAFIKIGDLTVKGVPEDDVDRTNADGKASSVQFIHFPFTEAQVDAFKAPDAQVVLGFGHSEYSHMAVMSEPVRAALADDFET